MYRISREGRRSLVRLTLVVMIAVLPAARLQAATLYWSSSTDGLWTNAANWSTNPVTGGSSSAPTGTDVVVFNQSSVTRGQVISFNADASITGISIANTGSSTLASDSASGRTLTIGAGGLTVFGNAGSVTLGSASNPLSVAVSASQTWSNSSTNSLQVLGGVTSSAASGTQTLAIAGTGSISLSGVLGNGGAGGTLALWKQGGGTLTLAGAATNTYTGNTTVSSGTLLLDYANLGTPTDLIASTSALVVNGGAMVLKGKSSGATSQSFAGTSITGGGGQVLVDPNGGTSTTVNLGSLPALNAWSAGTTLLVGKAAGSGTGTATVTTTTGTDATGIYGGRMVYFNGTANTGYDWATSSGSGPYTLAAYSGYSSLATSGTDTANSRLTANTSLTGNVTTNSLKIENPAASQSLALGSNTLTLSSGGLLVTGSNAFSITGGPLTAGNGSGGYELIVHQYSNATTTISGSITNNGANAVSLTKSGAGTLTLSAANTYSGNVLVNAGALSLASGGGASGSNLGSNTVGKNVTVAAGATLVSAATDAVDFLSNVVNNIAFTISGTWNNNPANTSATGFQRVDTLTLNGAVINDYGNHGANYGAILMAGTTTIYGTSTYNQLGLGVGLGTGTATVFNVPDATGRFVVNGGLRDVPSATGVGLGTLTKTGSGTMVVGGSSSYTGSTKVSGGTLSVTSSNALSKSTTVTVAGGVLDLGSVSSTVAGFSVSSGTLAGTGKLTATTYALAGGSVNANLGAGTLTVTANSALNGTTDSATVNVNSGTLTLGSGGRFTSSSVVVSGSSGGTLVLGGNETIFALGPTGAYGGNNVDLGNGTLTLTGSTGDRKYDGVISGSGGVIMSVAAGINILRLNQQQTFTGGMTVNAGYLVLNATNTLATTGIVNLNGGSIDIGAIPQTWAGLSGSGGGIYAGSSGGKSLTLSVASGTSYTFSGVLGTGNNYTYPNFAIVKAGGGTQVLSGSNIYTGTTSVTGGILQFVRPASLYSGSTASWTAANVSTGSGATLAVSVGASNFTTGNVTTLLTNFGGLGGSVNNNGLQAGSSIGFDTSLAGGSFTVADSIKDSTGTGGGAIGLVKLGTGTLALTGTNTFSGATTITGGMLSIAGTNSLRGTSGVTIAGGAGLTYTGAADTFDRNITVTAGSGTGTVTNSGGGLLTLAGTLSKDNSVLRLTGGSFNVTGLITGTTVGASDLVVDAAGVTLSNTNTYNGPTFVYNSGTLTLGITNAIPATSVVTLGNGTSAGTLQLNGYTDAIGGLAFGSGGGTLRLSATSTSAAPLTAAAGTMTLTNGTLDLAGSGSTAGLYRVLSAQTIAGAFSSVTGASAAYQLLTTSTTIDYQQKAVLGAVAVTNPAVSIITGGSAAFTYTMANDALSGGATLSYTGTGLLNVAGSSSGSAAAGSTSGATSGLFFTGTTVGSGQGTFMVNAPTAYGSTTATGTVSVTVLDHATSSLAATLTTSTTISLGIWNYSSQTWESGTNSALFSIYNIASIYNAGFTANLSLLGVTGTANGFSTNLGGYAAIAGGTSGAYSIFFDPTGFNSPGSQSTTFVLSMSDDTGLSGAMATNTLYVTASVAIVSVPEPGGLVLAGIGAIGATWVAQRRRRRAS